MIKETLEWLELPATPVRELKVWLHQLSSEGLPVRVEIQGGDQKQDIDLSSANGQVVLPINGQSCRVEVTFAGKSVSDLPTSL